MKHYDRGCIDAKEMVKYTQDKTDQIKNEMH